MVLPPEDDHNIQLRDYVEVVNTDDEFEGLIGVVEDFYDEDNNSCSPGQKGAVCLVRIPLMKRDQAAMRLSGVNFITSYVRLELRNNDELCLFPLNKLEWFDPNEL